MYNSECEWEARERERERFSHPITKYITLKKMGSVTSH
jgi:hypothetical protein